jgi:hypothetical protein
MVAVVVGVVLVLVASVVAGIAVFGRPPAPQPATNPPADPGSPVTEPSSGLRQNRPDAQRVNISTATRLRSGLLLVLAAVVIAAFVGVALSVVVVGLGLLVS